MKLGKIFSFILLLVLIALFFFYMFPNSTLEFKGKNINNNFSLNGQDSMQFYPNLRFETKDISYNISGCELQKKDDMIRAFDFIENITSLRFREDPLNPEIYVSCEDTVRYSGELFIAGEGGPTNIISCGNFNVITKGEILLLRKTSCPNPNIAIHELLHVLGFKHSSNPDNILYNITQCDQTVSQDIVDYIEKLYSISSLPDLSLYNASAKLRGRFLDVELTIMNEGLKNSQESQLIISSNGGVLKKILIPEINIGTGRVITLTNLWVSQITLNEIDVFIENNFEELNKENNKIKLELNE